MPNWYFDDKAEEIRELANEFLNTKDYFKHQKKFVAALEQIALDQRNACEKAITESNMFHSDQLLNVLSIVRNAKIK